MGRIPDAPFLNERFGPKGGGIDFLGMRRENLRMLQEYLIPGINNGTSDFGTYCLAAWIPWKFRQLARNRDEYTLSRYRSFREAVEIAIAYTMRDHSPSNSTLGQPRNRIGVQQNVDLNKPLTFKSVGRTDATTLFAAALYGPSLRYVNLISGDALADNLTSTGIPMTAGDEMTTALVEEVESSLRSCAEFQSFDRLTVGVVTGEALDQLGLHGLNPAYYRTVRPAVKQAFLRKFLIPQTTEDMADYRRLTAHLICETIRQHDFISPDELRAYWYSGLLPTGEVLQLAHEEIVQHRERWALFQARQIQRTIAEILLRCFELALKGGAQSIPEIIHHWRLVSSREFDMDQSSSFEEYVRSEAAPVTKAASIEEMSGHWHAQVHGRHQQYDDLPAGDISEELWRAVRMLARWFIRMQRWLHVSHNPEFLQFGSRDRMSIRWFSEWLFQRRSQPLVGLLEDCFSEIVFSQHIKVALARFDGELQRLRFTLGDSGIIPTVAAASKLGQSGMRTQDRLSSFLGLLTDLDVIKWTDGQPFVLGSHAEFTLPR
jgi:hypothetical protein